MRGDTAGTSVAGSVPVVTTVLSAEAPDGSAAWQAPAPIQVSLTEEAAAPLERMLTNAIAFVTSRPVEEFASHRNGRPC